MVLPYVFYIREYVEFVDEGVSLMSHTVGVDPKVEREGKVC